MEDTNLTKQDSISSTPSTQEETLQHASEPQPVSSSPNDEQATQPETLAEFISKKKEINTPSPVMIKTCRIVSVLFMLFAVGYVIMLYDFDGKGFIGYIDDFFVFMAAFTFLKSSFMKPEQKFLRRQFNMISLIMFCLALCWLVLLAFLPA